jgi:microbial collagenase
VDLIPAPNQPPSAQFGETAAGLVVRFEDRSADTDGSVASWLWSFGDGTVSTERHPVKTYTASGSYAVTLTVTDDRAASSTSSSTITLP